MIKNNVNTSRKYGNIFNISLNSTQKSTLLRDIQARVNLFNSRAKNYKQFYIVTPNCEIVSLARQDAELKKIINKADFSVPDGIGLAQAAYFLDLPNPKNRMIRLPVLLIQGIWVMTVTWFDKKRLFSALPVIKGRELFESLVALANKKGWRIALLGDRNQSAEKAATAIKKNYHRVSVYPFSQPDFDNRGRPLNKQGEIIQKKTIDQINQIKPQLIFVGFGAPKQEKWVFNNLKNLDCAGAMVVGGTFDYLSGVMKLPPKVWLGLELEWLWRLFASPRRFRRILTAFPLFPIKVFIYKLKSQN